jgi:preprotein translocase subunit Sss1
MLIILVSALIVLIFLALLFRGIILDKINDIIDEKFESAFLEKTNGFIRFFISENKKASIRDEYTWVYREKAAAIAATVIIGLIIALIAVIIFKHNQLYEYLRLFFEK